MTQSVVAVPPMVAFGFELRLTSLNVREHWARKAKRVKRERWLVQLSARGHAKRLRELGESTLPLLVTLERNGPRMLDDDNLAGAFKAIRDEVARLLGRDDGPSSGITWRPTQVQAPCSIVCVRVEIGP